MDSKEKKDSDIYFLDGNLVLSAEASSDNGSMYMFRVHRVFLANASGVFADMFTVVSAEHAQEADKLYDGVPLIHMLSDDAADVRALLRIIYKPSELYRLLSHTPVSDLPVVIAPVLRIVKKYMVQDLEKVIIDHVKSAWPTSLEEWSKYALRPRDFRFTDAMYEPVAAFLFAIEHNVPKMLPATFYQITISEVTSWQYEDSEWKRNIDWAETAPQARWDTLSKSQYMVAFLQARNQLDVAIRKQVKKLLFPPKGNAWCARNGSTTMMVPPAPQCLADLQRMTTDGVIQNYLFSEDVGVLDCLAMLKSFLDAKTEMRETAGDEERSCDACWQNFFTRVYAAHYSIWGEIRRISQSFIEEHQ